MYDLFLPPRSKALKDVLEILKEQSDEIRSIPPAVFFEKAVLKTFRKFLEKFLSLLEEIWYELSYGCFSQNFPNIFRTAMLKRNCIFMKWVLWKKRMGYLKTQ